MSTENNRLARYKKTGVLDVTNDKVTIEAMAMQSPQPPSMGYERHNTARWIRMFETMCARYRCRSVESVNPFVDEDLWLSGPDGVWLAEITSVEFDEMGALTIGSLRALRALGRAV